VYVIKGKEGTEEMEPTTIIDISLVISLLVFGLRVLVKEAKAVLGDLFQLIVFALRWCIHIRRIVKEGATMPALMPEERAWAK